MIVRREHEGDHEAVRRIHAAAFDRGDGLPVEVVLLDALRADEGWLPHLSWVAEIDGRPIGAKGAGPMFHRIRALYAAMLATDGVAI